jgi:hypothetical protein
MHPCPQPATETPGDPHQEDDTDTSRRPPNAFLLYALGIRTQVRQENPSLSSNEVGRLLGKMWKELSSEVKIQYKQQALQAQNEFKRLHPNYTYRKARRKRALNQLLAKSTQALALGNLATDIASANQAFSANLPFWMQMYEQGVSPGPVPGFGLDVAPQGDAGQSALCQFTPN